MKRSFEMWDLGNSGKIRPADVAEVANMIGMEISDEVSGSLRPGTTVFSLLLP